MFRALRARVALIVTALSTAVAVVVIAPPADAATPGSPQDCVETLQCTIGDFNNWTMSQRQSFVRGLENGYAQEFQAGFLEWRAVEGVIEFFNSQAWGAPGTWVSYVDSGILLGMERGLAMDLGLDSLGDLSNPGADLWEKFLLDLQAGKLTSKTTHDLEWGQAEQASTNYGLSQVPNGVSPTSLQQGWFQVTQAWRWLLQNESQVIGILDQSLGPGNAADQLIADFTVVNNDKLSYYLSALALAGSAFGNLINDWNDNNWGGVATDILSLADTCGSCSGGGVTPAPLYSVYDVPGGGTFRSAWQNLGGALGVLGDPVSNWYPSSGGEEQDFAGGSIYWTTSTGTVTSYVCPYPIYQGVGGDSSHLGFPTDNPYAYNGGTRQDFVRGYILCNGAGVTGVYYTGPFSSSPLIIRSNANGLYVSAELGYTGSSYAMLRARSSSRGSWETWNEIPLDNGMIALQSAANGDFVSTEVSYTGSNYGELRARATVIGPDEEYTMVGNSNGSYSLRSSANGMYVSAELGYTGSSYAELRARSSSIGPWEEYDNFDCTSYGPYGEGPNSCDSGFSTTGSWNSGGGVGLYGREIWAHANQGATATYQLSGMDTSHVWQLQAYIPNNDSDATYANYYYCAPGNGCDTGTVNQNDYTNQWADFGAVCTSDGTASVVLSDDNLGDPSGAYLGADAIRAVRTSYAC